MEKFVTDVWQAEILLSLFSTLLASNIFWYIKALRKIAALQLSLKIVGGHIVFLDSPSVLKPY